MNFQYQLVPRILENALDLRAFEVSINKRGQGVIVTQTELDQMLSHFTDLSGVDLRMEAATTLTIVDLRKHLCENWAEVATRIRDFAINAAAIQPGYRFDGCSLCSDDRRGEIKTPFGARPVNSFAMAFRAVSEACQSGITIETGVSILQQILRTKLPLEEHTEEETEENMTGNPFPGLIRVLHIRIGRRMQHGKPN